MVVAQLRQEVANLKAVEHATTKTLTGYVDQLHGAKPWLTGVVSESLYGDASCIRGDVTGLVGAVTGVHGYVTGLVGNLDTLGLTAADRRKGVGIRKLVCSTWKGDNE